MFDYSPGTVRPLENTGIQFIKKCISFTPKALVRDTAQGKHVAGVCCENPSLEP